MNIKTKSILLSCFVVYSCTSSSDNDPDMFTIGGTLPGNTGEVTLNLNGTTESFMGSSFTFSQQLTLGDPYLVTFVASSDDQTCDISNGGGIISGNVTNIIATCSTETSETPNKISFDHTAVTGNLTSGDFNGDGFTDLAMSLRTLSTHPDGGDLWPVRILYGDGNGAFNDSFDIFMFEDPNTNRVGRYFLALDFDQDGIDDFANSNQAALEVFRGMSSTSPERVTQTNGYAGEPIDVLDANGDGYPDIVSIAVGGSQLNYFGIYRYQDGNLAEPIYAGNRDDEDIQNLRIGYPLNFSTGDFDGSGIEDILSIVQTQSQAGENGIALVLFKGNGDSTFENPSEIIPLPNTLFLGANYFDNESREIGTGDLDGDGDLDVALMASSNFIQIYLNDGTGTFTSGQTYEVGNHPIHIRIEDFDLDGNLDIFTLNSESRDFSLLYGSGNAAFSEATHTFIDNNADVYDVTIGNFDDNNYLDIAIADNSTRGDDNRRGAIFLYFNQGLE